jgi:hypothetical protein
MIPEGQAHGAAFAIASAERVFVQSTILTRGSGQQVDFATIEHLADKDLRFFGDRAPKKWPYGQLNSG